MTANPNESPQELDVEETAVDSPWHVVLFNDEVHSFDDVIIQLIKATNCDSIKAEQLAWTVHSKGKAKVFNGSFERCFNVTSVLNEISLSTEICG